MSNKADLGGLSLPSFAKISRYDHKLKFFSVEHHQSICGPPVLQLSLFGGVSSLAGIVRSTRYSSGHSTNGNVIYVKIIRPKIRKKLAEQYTDKIVHLNNYIPIQRRGFLKRSFSNFVARDDRLEELASALENAGMFSIGDVVQRSPEDLMQIAGVTTEAIDILLQFLEPSGLRLGMKALGWIWSDISSRPIR